MKPPCILPIFALTVWVLNGQSPNPLLTESTLPYNYPRFDQLRDEHFRPAIEQGMREELEEVEAIAASSDAPTFKNTVVALERKGQLLERAQQMFFSVTGVNVNPALEALQRELSPKLAAHNDAIHLNARLFARIENLYNRRDTLGLDTESAYLLERYYKDFVRAGAKLSDADKAKLRSLNEQLAGAETTFRQNLLNETNNSAVHVETSAELQGMSESEIAGAAAAAKKAGRKGFLLRLQNTTSQPPLSTLKNRALRQRILEASLSRGTRTGEYDNRGVVARIVRLRAERAALLGYQTHADYQLEDKTAKSVSAVNNLLGDIAPKAVANARREGADMQALVDAEGGGFKLAAWDWPYYAEKVRAKQYAFDESQLRSYLELNRVLQDGVFYAAGRLYGLTFKERRDLPVYLPEVRVFEVFDAGNKPLAIFIADYYERPSKRGGAWANMYVRRSGLLGRKPVVANHLNIPKPPEGEPALLTWDQVRTMFHEFGHALHCMFSDVMYPRFSGARVPSDFVEFPSQANEMWAVWPEVLNNYAKHYKTGETMPAELLRKVQAAEQFNEGYRTTEYLAAAMLDQAWHQLTPQQIPSDTLSFEAEALKRAGVDLTAVPSRYRSTYFAHIFTGTYYSAGYYSYIWSEVLAADTVEWFRERGGLKRDSGDHFRRTLLSRGGSEDAMTMYRKFRGRDPQAGPLLRRRGLDK